MCDCRCGDIYMDGDRKKVQDKERETQVVSDEVAEIENLNSKDNVVVDAENLFEGEKATWKEKQEIKKEASKQSLFQSQVVSHQDKVGSHRNQKRSHQSRQLSEMSSHLTQMNSHQSRMESCQHQMNSL